VLFTVVRAVEVNITLMTNKNHYGRGSFDSVVTVASTPDGKKSPRAGATSLDLLRRPLQFQSNAQRRDTELFFRGPRIRQATSPTGSLDERLTSAVASKITYNLSRLLNYAGLGGLRERRRVLHLIMRPDAIEDEEVEQLKSVYQEGRRRRSEDDAFSDGSNLLPLHDLHQYKTNNEKSKESKFSGAQFNTHRKVRSKSFLNECGAGSGQHTLDKWVRDQTGMGSSSTMVSNSNTSPTRSIAGLDDLIMAGDLELSKLSHRRTSHQNGGKLKSGRKTPVAESPKDTKIFYIAEYFASDDDFLMKSAVRKVFKENAFETADAVLFSIPTSNRAELLEGADQHPALPNFAYAVEEEEAWEFWKSPGFKWVIFAYGVFSFCLVKFLGEYFIS
jgi:hypothetical protein